MTFPCVPYLTFSFWGRTGHREKDGIRKNSVQTLFQPELFQVQEHQGEWPHTTENIHQNEPDHACNRARLLWQCCHSDKIAIRPISVHSDSAVAGLTLLTLEPKYQSMLTHGYRASELSKQILWHSVTQLVKYYDTVLCSTADACMESAWHRKLAWHPNFMN